MQIRRVQSQDVPEVLEHVARVLEEFGLQFGSGSATDDALRNLPLSYDDFGGAFWIARGDRGELLGTCGVIPVDEQRFELRKMYLDPRARGHGLGAQLLALAVEWATLHGGQRLVLDTTEAMSAAIAFYERNGFVRDDSEIRGSRCTRGYTMRLPPARG